MVRKILTLGLVLLSLATLVGCESAVEKQIRKDYLKLLHEQGEVHATLADVRILNTYAIFGDVVVVRINRGAFSAITEVEVGGITFVFSDTNTALVWKSGTFFEMNEAYEKNILTRKDLEKLERKIS